jgi:hypothetical protein
MRQKCNFNARVIGPLASTRARVRLGALVHIAGKLKFGAERKGKKRI